MMDSFTAVFWIIPDLRCQKRLWILCFSAVFITIWRRGAFSRLYILANLGKRKAVVCDLWLVDFDPFCVFLCFMVCCFDFEKHRKFYLSSKFFFFNSLYWNVASLDSKDENVPIELPNPEETQIRNGENELVRSRQHLHLLTNNWQTQWMLR